MAQPLAAVGPSSRGSALGPGYVAVAAGAEGMLWNPGVLGSNSRIDFGLHHSSWLVETFQDALSFSLPLRSKGTLGLAAQYSNYGEFERRNAGGELIGTTTAMDAGGAAGWGMKLHPRLSGGAMLRGQWVKLGDFNSGTFAADLGLLWDVPMYGLKIGAAYANLGTPLDEAQLASQFRLGFARPIALPRASSLTILGGATIEAGSTHKVGAGVEAVVLGVLSLRGSYNVQVTDRHVTGVDGLAAGLGLYWRKIRADYTWLPYGSLGTAHRFSLGWTFASAPKEKPIAKKPKPRKKTAKKAASPSPEPVRTPVAVKASPTPMADPQAKVEAKADGDSLKVRFSLGGDEVDSKERQYLDFIEKNPDNPAAWNQLARYYYDKGEKQKSIQAFEEVLRIRPNQKLKDWLEQYRKAR